MAKFKRGSLTLARQVFNTPQLIIQDDLQAIAQYLVSRANGEVEITPKAQAVEVKEDLSTLSDQEQRERRYRQLGITNDGKRGNLEITGTLVAKSGEIDADCMELTSYEKLFSTFQQQVNEGIEELVLHVDSGGGSAFTCFEMATEVKNLANEKGIKIYAYIDGMSASAAYAWTSIADEIVARPDAQAGSVGVVVQLINNSKMLENIGLTRTFVYNGEQKIPFLESGEFSPKFLSNIQTKVDKTGLEFNSFVAKNRNMKVEDVIATQAEVFDAEEALKVGFVDKIMTKSEFFNDYLPKAKSNQSTYFLQSEENMSKEKLDTPAVEELQANADLPIQLSTALEQNKELTNQLVQVQESLTALEGEKSTLSSQLQELTEKYEQLEQEKVQQEAQAKMQKRQAMLEEALGKDNEKLQDILTSTEALSDDAFDIVAQGFGASVEKQQASLEEKGGEGKHTETQLSFADKVQAQMKKLK